MAILENNVVTNIVVCEDDEPETSNFVTYTNENPAYIGGDYVDGYFYSLKPFPSWLRDNKGGWIAPIPKPNDNDFYSWDEDAQGWVKSLTLEQTSALTADSSFFIAE